MTLKANDLEVEKTVYQDGRFQIQLQAGEDRLSLAVGTSGITLDRAVPVVASART